MVKLVVCAVKDIHKFKWIFLLHGESAGLVAGGGGGGLEGIARSSLGRIAACGVVEI